MAEAKKKQTVKMYGTGNFVIGKTLYVFRDGEEVEVKKVAHKKILEAEATRREKLQARLDVLRQQNRA